MISIPTEPIGSIPRPLELIQAVSDSTAESPDLDPLYDAAIRDTIARFEETRSPVITDGEQRKYHNFWTYSVHGLPNTAPDGFRIPFSAGHVRRMPRLTAGPFRYKRLADSYLDDVLDVSRIVAGKMTFHPAPTDIAPVVRAAMTTVHPAAAAKGIEILASIPPQLPPVLGDEGRLQQIIWNLLSNAVKFTPRGGTVTVRVMHVGSVLRLVVQDTGKGIGSGLPALCLRRLQSGRQHHHARARGNRSRSLRPPPPRPLSFRICTGCKSWSSMIRSSHVPLSRRFFGVRKPE